MKKEKLKYLGRSRNEFLFANGTGKEVKFSKCRKDLIEDYQLHNGSSINDWFEISYFEVKPLTLKDMDNHTLIISDIQAI